jgi:hypothetical protein
MYRAKVAVLDVISVKNWPLGLKIVELGSQSTLRLQRAVADRDKLYLFVNAVA